jgi:AcrR family transcriptional regulator
LSFAPESAGSGYPCAAEILERSGLLGMILSMRALPGRTSRVTLESPPASVTRAGAHGDQRRRILRATGELVAENGYAELTVEQIVKRAHCSYKTFYKHFSGKEAAFIALFETSFRLAQKTIREHLTQDSGSWADQVAVALRVLVDLILAEPAIARAVIVETPTLGPAITKRYEEATKALSPLLRAGREQSPRGGELPATIEDTLAGSVVWAAYQRLVVGEAEELRSYLPVLLELILRTYLGETEASRIARAQIETPEPALV